MEPKRGRGRPKKNPELDLFPQPTEALTFFRDPERKGWRVAIVEIRGERVTTVHELTEPEMWKFAVAHFKLRVDQLIRKANA